MARTWIVMLAVAAAVTIGGCTEKGWPNWQGWQQQKSKPESKPPSPPPPNPLEMRVKTLTEENRTLADENTRLNNRSAQLADRVNKLEFENDQLRKQIEVVGEAPRQRDEYKARSADLQLENERLKRLVDELLKRVADRPRLAPLTQTTAPTSAPADAGDEK